MTKAPGKAMQARDVMTTEVCTVDPDTPLQDLAKLLVDRRISAVPVLDSERRVIGIVSEGDLLRRQETATEQRRSWWLEMFANRDALAREYVKAHGMQAHHVMTRHVLCASETMSLGEIADLLDHHKIKRVPVVRDGRLVGIVSRSDLVRAFLAADSTQPRTALPPNDRGIRAELQRRLREQPWSHSSYLQSVVHDGVVEFFGVTRSEDERRALEVLAETIPGVTRVEDRTTIGSYLAPM